jgi:hypothetical protein
MDLTEYIEMRHAGMQDIRYIHGSWQTDHHSAIRNDTKIDLDGALAERQHFLERLGSTQTPNPNQDGRPSWCKEPPSRELSEYIRQRNTQFDNIVFESDDFSVGPIVIDRACLESYPCKHRVHVDGVSQGCWNANKIASWMQQRQLRVPKHFRPHAP